MQQQPYCRQRVCSACSAVKCGPTTTWLGSASSWPAVCRGYQSLQQQLLDHVTASIRATGYLDLLQACIANLPQLLPWRSLMVQLGSAVLEKLSTVLGAVHGGHLLLQSEGLHMLKASQGCPELQAKVVAAVAAALANQAPEQRVNVGTCLNMVTALLQGQRQLQSELEEALLCAAVARSEAFNSQPEEDLCALALHLLRSPELRGRGWLECFVQACVARPSRYLLLRQMLEAGTVLQHLELPAVQLLVEAQVALLQEMLQQPPDFSWCMPQASLPGYPQVRLFCGCAVCTNLIAA